MEGDLLEEGGQSGAQTDADDQQEPLDAGDAPPADGTTEAKSSKFRGVSWHRKSGRWRATIKLQGNKVQIGAYKDEEEAARAFDGAAVKYVAAWRCNTEKFASLCIFASMDHPLSQ